MQIKKEWENNEIFNKYIKNKISNYSEEEIEKMIKLNVTQLEFFYLVERDILRFKNELDDYIGSLCRRYFQGFQQKLERYRDLREDVWAFVLSCLEGKNGKKYIFQRQTINKKGVLVTNKFDSYLHLLVRWGLSNYFRYFNKKRIIEVNYDLSSNKIGDSTFSESYNDNFNNNLIKIIEEFDLDIDIQSVLDYFYYYKDIDNEGNIFLNNEKENVINNSNINDFKLLNWVVYKRFL